MMLMSQKVIVMRKITIFITVVLFIMAGHIKLTAQANTQPEKRIALVIGNGNYQIGVLANPENDARAMKLALTKLGFEVEEYENLTQRQMKEAIDDFGMKLKNYDVGLCFYAGHGIQSKGVNYLIPVDANLKTEVNVEYDCVEADRILSFMEQSGAKVKILILDACRNNPFERSWSRGFGGNGLAQMLAPKGTLIEYATAPDKTASDGSGNNGLYTSAILSNIFSPDEDITLVFRKVRAEVVSKSNSQQVPWEASSLVGTFYFNPQNGIVESDQPQVFQPAMKIASVPVISTPEITGKTPFGSSLNVNVTDDGGAQVVARGVCYSTTPDPNINNSKTLDGVGTGVFTCTLTGLKPDKVYYVRAYAVNYMGTSYSPQTSFRTDIATPTVNTESAGKIEAFSAVVKGSNADNGGYRVLSRGFCWNTTGNATIKDEHRFLTSGFGSFSDSLTDLKPETKYFLRAFSSDSSGCYYGNEISFLTLKEDELIDVEGNIYESKKFLNQRWMIENLRTTKLNDGTPIALLTDKIDWKSNLLPAYCWYDNLEFYKDVYGALYNLQAIKSDKLCPVGWHVPSIEDWEALFNIPGRYNAGAFLKEKGYTHWAKYTSENQEYNSIFAGLPGGIRKETGICEGLGWAGYFWSSYDAVQALCWSYQLSFNLSTVSKKKVTNNATGISVRCVKNYSGNNR
jgi:uncharacterized protein (TIGR02145 family)